MQRLLLLTLFSSLSLAIGCDSDGDTESSTATTEDSQGDSTDPTDPTDTTAGETTTDPTDPTDTTAGGSSGGSTVTTDTATTDPSESEGETTDGGSTGGSTVTTTPTATDADTTDGSDPQSLCESTDGVWDETSCGHYQCGAQPECDAIDPGCDCGPDANFVNGEGCVADAACEEAEFACGDELLCNAPSQFCSVVVPGQPPPGGGNGFSYSCQDTPDECADDYSCDCAGFNGGPMTCQEADGGVTVTIFAP